MDIPDSRSLKRAAADSLAQAKCDPKKLVMLHTAAVLLVSLVSLVPGFVLEGQIGVAGGLSGLGTRSVLKTVQQLLQLAQSVLLPFWQIGWLYVSLKLARGKEAGTADFIEGFHRFFPFLRLMLLKGLVFAGAALLAVYVGSFAISMSPLSTPVMQIMMSATDLEAAYPAITAEMEKLAIPMLLICGGLALAFALPFFYRFRLAEYYLLDQLALGAMTAMRGSRRMMRGNALKLLRLDLSFWWYWLLEIVVAAVGFADVLLPVVGITLPWSEEVGYFVSFLLYALCQLLLYYLCKAKVDVTYAQVYESLQPPATIATERILPDA